MSYQIPRGHFRTNSQNAPFACYCGKSITSFPHWPPSTYEEAIEQLRCLIGESFPHRTHLVNGWVIHLSQKMATVRELSVKKDIEWTISLVERNCETEKHSGGEAPRRNVYEIDCGKTCEPALLSKSCECLCCCRRHREECPVHRLTM